MTTARALLVSLAVLSGTASASEVEIVQAVDPGWPVDADPAIQGRVTLEFVLSGRTIVSVGPRRTSLPDAFVAESTAAFREWLIESGDADACGFTRGTIDAVFDGRGAEPAMFGPLTIEQRPTVRGMPKLDRVEVGAGRIRRSEMAKLEARQAEQAAREHAEFQRWSARWRALGRAEQSVFVPAGLRPPVPKVRIEPTYPRPAHEQGVEGWVHSIMTVGANGSVYSVDVVGSEPPGTFDQATRAALRRWKLEPGRDATGKAVEMQVCQTIVYRLSTW